MKRTTIEKSIFFNVQPKVVWDYLVDKDKLSSWFHPARENLTLDEDYALIDGDGHALCWGKVLEMVEHEHLVYTFSIKPMGDVVTTVTWTLRQVHGGTKLSLMHEGLEKITASPLGLLRALDSGWDKHLSNLRDSANEQEAK